MKIWFLLSKPRDTNHSYQHENRLINTSQSLINKSIESSILRYHHHELKPSEFGSIDACHPKREFSVAFSRTVFLWGTWPSVWVGTRQLRCLQSATNGDDQHGRSDPSYCLFTRVLTLNTNMHVRTGALKLFHTVVPPRTTRPLRVQNIKILR